jgi:ABC-type polysaccharide transport system permease subunit
MAKKNLLLMIILSVLLAIIIAIGLDARANQLAATYLASLVEARSYLELFLSADTISS